MASQLRSGVLAGIVGFVASVIAIFTFLSGFSTLPQLLRELRSGSEAPEAGHNQVLPPKGPAVTSRKDSAEADVSPLVANALNRLELGQNVDYLVQILGPPIVMRRSTQQIPLGALNVDWEFLYFRFTFQEKCDVQLLATLDRSVIAFIIHGCKYSFGGEGWMLDKSTFTELGELTNGNVALVGGDAKFPAYVEKHYFGRSGHYHDFYFAGRWPGLPLDDSSLRDIDRHTEIVRTVAIVRRPNEIDDAHAKNWDEFISQIAGVHVTRFEGL